MRVWKGFSPFTKINKYAGTSTGSRSKLRWTLSYLLRPISASWCVYSFAPATFQHFFTCCLEVCNFQAVYFSCLTFMTSPIKCIGCLSLTNPKLLNVCGCIHYAAPCVCVKHSFNSYSYLIYSQLYGLCIFYLLLPWCFTSFLVGSDGKESACNAWDLGLIPELGRSPGEENGYPLQYSGLENSMDCIVHGVARSWTWLSEFHSLMHFFTV